MTYSAGPSRFTTEEENLQLSRQAQAEYEAQQQQQGGNNFIDSLGKAALVAGVGTLAALGGRRLLANRAARNATQQVRVEDLGNIGRKAEADVRRAAASTYAAPAPSQPPPSQPTPGGMIDRLGKMAEDTRQARSERMPGVIQTDLSKVSPERARAALGIINNRVLNPRNSTVEEGVQSFFRESPAYGQLPEVVQQVVSEVKALPPARTTGTDFLTSQLGGRGYIEQTVLDRAAEQAAGDLIDEVNAFSNKAARSELAKQGASVQSQQRKNLWSLVNEIQNETLVDEQQATRAFNVDQAINALDAAEDQQTGRVKQQLQRNEDVDLSKIELQEDMAEASRQAMINEASPSQMIGYEADAAINQVASQLPDGLPVDQAEGVSNAAQKFVTNALNKQRPLKEPLLEIETKMYDLVATAAESGLKLEPKRALSILTNPNLELTTDEIKLFSINPQVGKFALKGQGYAPGQEQTGKMLSVKSDLLESIPNIGLDPQSSVYNAASGTSIRGRSRVQNQPDQFRQRFDSLGNPVREDVMSVDPGGTLTISTGEELTELDIPEELKTNYTRFVKNPITGKTEEQYAPKGMRAISTVEGKTYYVPIQDPGGVGIYGVERSYASGPVIKYDMPEQERIAGTYTKTALRKPTDMPYVEKTQGGSGFSELDNNQLQSFISKAPEGRVRQAGVQELNRRQISQRSLEASEAVRRASIEGRDPQDFLQNFEFKKAEPMTQEPSAAVSGPSSTGESIYDLPMNFAYQGNAIPGTPATTFEALQSGLRTSTLRKLGQVPSRVQPGARITAIGPKGERQLLEVTGRQMVTPEMANQLSEVERWTPDFLRNYINKVGGGKLEQITYKTI